LKALINVLCEAKPHCKESACKVMLFAAPEESSPSHILYEDHFANPKETFLSH
jgi:hypothetical protein